MTRPDLSTHDVAPAKLGEGGDYSANCDSAKTKLHLTVKAAMGEVNVEWVK